MADSGPGPLPEDEAEAQAAAVVQQALREYAADRTTSYDALQLSRLLSKDVLMFAMRGVSTSAEFVDAAFAAFESSSEETHMGSTWQRIFAGLAARAVDLSDLLVEKDDDLWVVEIKSQTNTTTGRFRADLLRELKARVQEYSRVQSVRRGRVRAMIGVVRGPATNRDIPLKYAPRHRNADLDGFEYRLMVGAPFLEWLIGRPSILSLVGDVSESSQQVANARANAVERLQNEIERLLAARGDDRSIQAVLDLIDEADPP